MTNKILTLVEGRESHHRIYEDVARAAMEMGWGFQRIAYIDLCRISDDNYEDLFSDYVWWRSLHGNTYIESMRIMRWLEVSDRHTLGVEHIVGGRQAMADKYYQHGLFHMSEELKDYILPMYPVKKAADVRWLVDTGRMKYPMVLKPAGGAEGKGIILLNSDEDVRKYSGSYNDRVVEPFIKTDHDWRVFVVGGKGVGVMRKSWGDEKASFVDRSAGTEKTNETDAATRAALIDLAEKAAKVCGLDYAGVDLIQSPVSGKYYVLEVNYGGGWSNGFIEATGVDVPKEVLKWFESLEK